MPVVGHGVHHGTVLSERPVAGKMTVRFEDGDKRKFPIPRIAKHLVATRRHARERSESQPAAQAEPNSAPQRSRNGLCRNAGPPRRFQAGPASRSVPDPAVPAADPQDASPPVPQSKHAPARTQSPKAAKPKRRARAAAAPAAPGVHTAVGHLSCGDRLSVKWVSGDGLWYSASVEFASSVRGIGLRFDETPKYAVWSETISIDEATAQRVRRGAAHATASPTATATIPINKSQIPAIGDKVEVEFDEGDDLSSDFTIYPGTVIAAQTATTTSGTAQAYRLGHAKRRAPAVFRVRFACGSVSTLTRGKHRWRQAQAQPAKPRKSRNTALERALGWTKRKKRRVVQSGAQGVELETEA